MSWFLLGMLLFFPGCRAEGPLIPREEIAVRLDPGRHLLTGKATVTIFPRGTKRLMFRLAQNASVAAVTAEGHSVPFTFSGGNLAVELSGRQSGRETVLTISYSAVFNDPLPQHIASTEDPTYGVTAVIRPEGAFLGNDAGWYPDTAVAVRERTLSISAPAGFEAITAGERLSHRAGPEGVVSTWKVTLPGESMSLSAGPYVISERQMDGITLATYFYKDNAPLATRYLDAAAHYIRYFQELLGPYPFKKFAIVENFLPTGYGFPSYTLIGSKVIRLPFIVNTSLPHEIAHCWWGNGIRPASGRGNWSEGLATYFADYLLEEKRSPDAAREYRQKILTDYASLVTPDNDFSVIDFVGRVDPASRAIGYGKSAMIFHMIRMKIGDKAFFQALRDMIRDKMFEEASWSDFFRAFSISSGKDMLPFMNQWLYRPGGPRLALRNVVVERNGSGWHAKGFIEQTEPFYSLTVSLLLEAPKEKVERHVSITGHRTSFAIHSLVYPTRLLLDPDVDLFRILSTSELPPAVNRVKGSGELMVVVADGCRADVDDLKLLLDSLGQGKAPVVRERDVSSGGAKVHDLLVCGTPSRADLMPELPPEVAIAGNSFSVEGASFASPGDALMVVGGHPSAAERVAALFLPLSESAAAASVPKITHYGKFGYLVFREGRNQKKGTQPMGMGETVVTFAGAAR